jgi:hypothetical protein
MSTYPLPLSPSEIQGQSRVEKEFGKEREITREQHSDPFLRSLREIIGNELYDFKTNPNIEKNLRARQNNKWRIG